MKSQRTYALITALLCMLLVIVIEYAVPNNLIRSILAIVSMLIAIFTMRYFFKK